MYDFYTRVNVDTVNVLTAPSRFRFALNSSASPMVFSNDTYFLINTNSVVNTNLICFYK
jgi:hypothetical protein